MIGAAQATVFHEAVVQRDAAVRAVVGQATVIPLRVAEDDQLLAQDGDALLGLLGGQLTGDGDGLPVAAQQLATGRARAHLREPLVLFLAQHEPLLTRTAHPPATAEAVPTISVSHSRRVTARSTAAPLACQALRPPSHGRAVTTLA